MTIAGVVMVHDEKQTIGRAIASFRRVCDPIIVLDVGSTDGAIDIARELGAEIHAQTWTTHGDAAETLLRLARDRADYALLFGATETIEQTGPLPDKLDAPVYLLPARKEGVVFYTERLFKSGIDWTCPGPVHSTVMPLFLEERQPLDAFMIEWWDDDGRRPGKLERYRKELEEWLKTHPRDTRSTYYLAQAYFFLEHKHTAAGLYKRRAEMTQGDEESWHSLYMAAVCELHYDFARGAAMLIEAHRRRPHRMEPIWILQQACHQVREQTALPGTDDLLFVMPEAYLKGMNGANALTPELATKIARSPRSEPRVRARR